MTSLHQEIEIAAAADTTWAVVRDFGAVHERFAVGFVTDTAVDGDERVVTFANGTVAREKLLGIDDDRRRFAYAVIESPLGLTHHNATFQVVAEGSERCRVLWDADVLPAEAAPTVEAMMAAGAEAIAASIGR